MPRKKTPNFASEGVSGSTKLPGFGRRVDHDPQTGDTDYIGDLLPNALHANMMGYGDNHLTLRTLKELEMLRFMEEMCSKPNWFTKVNDEEIVNRWEKEALEDGRLTEKMVKWCIDEVKYRASKVVDPTNPPPLFVYHGDVYRSDNAVSPALKKELEEAVNEFETKIPDNKKDWHPGSDGQVLDLVHPSLFPLVYGITRALPDGQTTLENCISRCGDGTTIPVPFADEVLEYSSSILNPFSKKFQWLPCEVDISGECAKVTTYINNLHPNNEKRLYRVIERLIDAAIPLWGCTLTPLETGFIPSARISCSGPIYDKNIDARAIHGQALEQMPGEDDWAHKCRREELIRSSQLQIPELETLFAPNPKEPETIDLKSKYSKTGIQVIVKFANIHLTPEKPKYGGGSWHVEGQLNEHIVSTALYYYSNENITTSSLSFRQQVKTEDRGAEFNYEQNDINWLEPIFGCTNDGPAVQFIGSVKTNEGRLLTFPNVLQHRVDEFELADPTKPGHRKIVALFLVDPRIKVISTANVPCQRKDWWWEEVLAQLEEEQDVLGSAKQPVGVLRLPVEIRREVENAVPDEFPYGMEKAEEYRLELMNERRVSDVRQNKVFQASRFSLCEH